jgi:hypothetical protein
LISLFVRQQRAIKLSLASLTRQVKNKIVAEDSFLKDLILGDVCNRRHLNPIAGSGSADRGISK